MSNASPDVVLQTELTNASSVDLSQAVVDLFDAHHQAIFGYLYRMAGRDRELAEELTQETFLKAFQARDQLPRIVNHRAWLYRVATNLALNARKRRSRFRWLPWSRAPEARTSIDALQGAEIRLDLERALDPNPFLSSVEPMYKRKSVWTWSGLWIGCRLRCGRLCCSALCRV